ncbi:hypothetical protein CR513_00825 [Mucuna pruriens]|uniref:Uncharacterized protein n=1 Tax=Mucuna pruriens TaxID=157652 RepID=A0A371IGN4_MUCPR|nr:hypothetical protein CR513_00825 [Mucuna pruriens]
MRKNIVKKEEEEGMTNRHIKTIDMRRIIGKLLYML